ncbi:methyltransferase domain-containing protein [Mycolicibacterium helvum]|uniref:methyltransferase domain-containing protein n=1 Tax=Mycolicibacterium helvum TaxID=1534349 RepID=UPI0018D72860|nr:methyltransferase domain-containing protein [Mycolicibacterium helvum]
MSLEVSKLECSDPNCGRAFPIVDGIPVLIDEENSVFSLSDFVARRDTTFSTRAPIVEWIRRLIPAIGVNLKARDNYDRFANLLLASSPTPRVLILGGSILGAGMEPLSVHADIEFVESDVAFGPRTGIILDGHSIPFREESFDGVIAQAVLEHVLDPHKIVEEIHRVLRNGGVIYAETPFMQQVHGGRYDFLRFTHLGHRRLFRRFDEHSSGAVSGTGTALAWSYKYFLMSLSNRRPIRQMLSVLAAFTSFWLKYVDYLTIDRPASLDGASGLYFLGTKSATVLSDSELLEQYRGAIGR